MAVLGCVSARRPDTRPRIPIGYRTVSPQQAAEYNSNGRLSYNPLRSAREQLGPGVYTTPGPGQWAGKPEDWLVHCLITGLENEIKFMDEVWIPRDYWWNARAMFEYVEENFEDVNLDYAMRLSRVDEHEDITQLLIPDHLVIEYSALFQVICKQDWRNLPHTSEVKYSSWDNVHGTPQ
ncbi:hypothetical protein LY78DRAFT_709772 [Colletotrichum sublineola]|nr:hypothetical protein LY78DRAFT_709772 [Colletotrichum sublineola]